jgi:hypothetical protein
MSFALSEASISSPKSSLAKPAKIHQKKPVAFVPLTDQDQQDTRSIDTLKILRAGDSITTLLPSAIFMGFAALLVKLVKNIQDSGLQRSIGVLALFFTSVTVGYDNFIIGLGKLFFADAETNERKRSILKVLSYPRFTAHAVFVPFLFTTVAEIGKGVGITWLESSNIQLIMIIAATVVGVYSRVQFVRGDGIQLADPDEDVPNKALQRELVWFTYVVSSRILRQHSFCDDSLFILKILSFLTLMYFIPSKHLRVHLLQTFSPPFCCHCLALLSVDLVYSGGKQEKRRSG